METLKKNILKNITICDEISNEMSNELLQQTSCGDYGLKLVIKICHMSIWKHAIFQIICDMYGVCRDISDYLVSYTQRTRYIDSMVAQFWDSRRWPNIEPT